jgi:hypothetical protein
MTPDATPYRSLPPGNASTDCDLRLGSCTALERILVSTLNSVYDVTVLSADAGEVMLHGGRLFPESHHAIIVGSRLGASAVKSRTICVGERLEFWVNGKPFITSPIRAVSRHPHHVAGETN